MCLLERFFLNDKYGFYILKGLKYSLWSFFITVIDIPIKNFGYSNRNTWNNNTIK